MCVLCDFKTPELKNFDQQHISSKINALTEIQIKSLLDTIPSLKQECQIVSDDMILPEKKRSVDQLIEHLEYLDGSLQSRLKSLAFSSAT